MYIYIYICSISSINHGSIEKIENLLRVDSCWNQHLGHQNNRQIIPVGKQKNTSQGPQTYNIHVSVHVYKHINLGWNCCFLGPKKEKAGNLSSSTKKRPTPNFIEPWTAELGPVPLLGVPCFLRVHVFVPGCVHLQKSDSKVPRVGSGRSLVGVRQLQNDFMKDSEGIFVPKK